MKRYDPQSIEPKWQEIWEKAGVFKTPAAPKNKQYVLDMFPYPSGDGLHTGHPRGYTATDVVSHYRRYTGHDVLHPMGWDAFGLPAENAAIKKGVHPAENTAKNVERFREQLKRLGYSYDWDREVNTSDPDYYKWTQWIFTELFKAGLAYRGAGQQWWCPKDKTVLANEQVIDGRCERCGSEVTKKELTQWYFKITEYADELIDSLDELDWPEPIKAMQRNWIGRSEGAEVMFESDTGPITAYTTRPDTLFGATYMVLAPEHGLVGKLTTKDQVAEVNRYVETAKRESDIARTAEDREKTGVFTGSYATNPVNGEKIPVWVADYVLATYGTGAIMAVPAHDVRDHEFAKKFKLEIRPVIGGPAAEGSDEEMVLPHSEEGVMFNSDKYDGLPSDQAREKIVADLEKKNVAKPKRGYKLRDWLISRQRYWGTPIPIIHCDNCGPQPVPEKDLPVELPDVKDYLPTGDGRSPLAKATGFVETTCPKCGGPAERETDTMDTFADSNWYFLRYPNPRQKDGAFDKEALKQWLPVDTYVGGAEHAVLHLLYARFWTKALADRKYLGFREPFKSLRNQGLIMAEDGRKMSKSLGNVVNPDDVIEAFGADTFRLFELFIGPFNQDAAWDTRGIEGCYRFLKRVWVFGQSLLEATDGPDQETDIAEAGLERAVSKATKRITASIEQFRFNTAVSGLMEALNDLQEQTAKTGPRPAYRPYFERYLVLLSPFAPHLAEELWRELDHEESIFTQGWPAIDESAVADDTVTIPVQVNGKVRTTLELPADGLSEETVTKAALADASVKKHLSGKPKKVIYVEGELLNLVG
ncbi:MAG: leucine--tRNA ligase [Patescibacteria group bacterium]